MEEEFYDASEAWSEGEGADSGDGGPQAATASAQAPPGEPTRAAEACGGCQPALGGAGEAYPLHRAAYYGDLEALDAALDAVPESQWTALDCCGNTALHVAVLREQRAAVERLLARGFPPAAKSAGGWGPVDYAIAGGNGELVAALHVATVRSREAEYRQRKPQLLAELAALPDFRGSLKWEFCSPLFGTLLRRFAPHDTYTVTKRGACLRVDGTLKGFAEDSGDSLLPSWDRGAFSLLFDGQAVADAAAREHATGASSPASRDAQGRQLALWLVDHDKQEVVDALPPGAQRSESELHEEAAQMLAQGATKAKLHAREFSFAPVKTWRGGMRRESAEGWPSAVYEARGVLESQHLLAGARRDTCRGSFQHYLATTGGAAAGGDTVQTFDFSDQAGEESRPHSGVAGADGSPFPSPPPSPRSSEESSPDGSPAPGASPADATHSERGKAPKASSKPSKPRAFKGTIWMAEGHPLSVRALFPLLDVCAAVNKHLAKVRRFLAKWADVNACPVRIVVPLFMTVYAQVAFRDFELLPPAAAAALPADYFSPPPHYRTLSMEQKLDAIEAVMAARREHAGGGAEGDHHADDDDEPQEEEEAGGGPLTMRRRHGG